MRKEIMREKPPRDALGRFKPLRRLLRLSRKMSAKGVLLSRRRSKTRRGRSAGENVPRRCVRGRFVGPAPLVRRVLPTRTVAPLPAGERKRPRVRPTLHRVSALCERLPESDTSAVERTQNVDAAGHGVRAGILPVGVREMLRSFSVRRDSSDDNGRQGVDADRLRRLGPGRLHCYYRRAGMRQLPAPLPDRGDRNDSAQPGRPQADNNSIIQKRNFK